MQAAGTLVAQLLGGQARDLNAVDISLSAWSLAVLVELDSRVCSSEARQLIDALAMRAVSSNVMEQQADEACRHWSRLLYGIAKVGVTCQDSADVQQLFTVALTQRMPTLLRSKQLCEPQNIANPL